MIKKSFVFTSASLLILVASMELASAQSSKEAEGRAAEQAGRLRDAFTHYVAALQSVPEGSADDQRLRETIIKLVQKLSPPPAVSEEAERRMARGLAAVKAATDEQGFRRAADEFSAAVKTAPWFADGYFNLGIILDKAGKHADAIRNLKLGILAAPNDPEVKKFRELVYEIEYRQEEAQRIKAEADRKAQEAARAKAEKQKEQDAYQQNLGFLAGRWIGTLTSHFERLNATADTVSFNVTAEIAINGKEIQISRIDDNP